MGRWVHGQRQDKVSDVGTRRTRGLSRDGDRGGGGGKAS